MTTRLIKLFVTLILVAIICAVFILNPQTATVNFGGTNSWTAPTALILVTTFCVGVILTALISALIGSRLSYQLWATKRTLAAKREHESLIAGIMELLAVNKPESAIKNVRRLLQEDPESVTGRILLAHALQQSGEEDEALKLIDETRSQLEKNAELLRTAAAIHRKRGNRTAEFDNLAVILTKFPTAHEILLRVVECAESIGQLETAKAYLAETINKLPYDQQEPLQLKLADLELRLAEKSGRPETFRADVEQILKRHREFAPAQAKLAELDMSEGKVDSALRNYQKATASSGEVRYLERAVELLLKQEQPTKAVAVVRATLDTIKESGRFQLAVFLTNLLCHLGMISEAKAELNKIQQAARSDSQHKQYRLLESMIVAKTESVEAANRILTEIGISEARLPGAEIFKPAQPKPQQPKRTAPTAPAPQLSTP